MEEKEIAAKIKEVRQFIFGTLMDALNDALHELRTLEEEVKNQSSNKSNNS